VRRAVTTLVLLLAAACSDTHGPDPGATSELVVHASDGAVTFRVEVADTPEEREVGLMDRETLDPYDGMAFVWEEPVRTSFWMRDTIIPLSIAFWDADGEIVAMFDMDPCTAEPCPSYAPEGEILGAVEVDRGRLAVEGIEVGDRVELLTPA
jgi:uncharacterized membrane protein (UPF0127 family)